MAGCIWQHTMTTLGVIAYALGGADAAERAGAKTGGNNSRNRPSAAQLAEYQRQWDESKAPWRLKGPPTHSPEEEEAQKQRALGKLFKLMRVAGEVGGQPPPVSRRARARARAAKGATTDVLADPEVQGFLDGLDRIDQLDKGKK